MVEPVAFGPADLGSNDSDVRCAARYAVLVVVDDEAVSLERVSFDPLSRSSEPFLARAFFQILCGNRSLTVAARKRRGALQTPRQL